MPLDCIFAMNCAFGVKLLDHSVIQSDGDLGDGRACFLCHGVVGGKSC